MHDLPASQTAPLDTVLLLHNVLAKAVSLTYRDVELGQQNPNDNSEYLKLVKQSWLRSLCEAFWRHYDNNANPQRIAAFGGKPRYNEPKESGVPSGVKKWGGRWEFQCDVSVVELDWIPAPYATKKKIKTTVPIIKKAIWLVESELAGNGTTVAEDASKLRIGRSENTLLIAARTSQSDPNKWLEFLRKTLRDVDGAVFIALLPSYALKSSQSNQWIGKTVEPAVFKCK